MPTKKRLDVYVLEAGFAQTREKAQALIMAGRVLVNGTKSDKPGYTVPDGSRVEVTSARDYVSRGGTKLAHALDTLAIDVRGAVALDVGASTGGFTDCLLQRGASKAYALDVGYGQIDYALRKDPRVVVMERVNAHHHFDLPEKADVCVADVSFISLTQVMPSALEWVKDGGSLVGLVKPQFEAGREVVPRGGVVKDPMVHGQVLSKIVVWVASQEGLRLKGITPSPIEGADGNREFFVWVVKE